MTTQLFKLVTKLCSKRKRMDRVMFCTDTARRERGTPWHCAMYFS